MRLAILFSTWLFLSIIFFLCSLISYQYAMNGEFNIMSHPKTICPGVACSVVWCIIRNKKPISVNIPDKGSYLSRKLFLSKTYVRGLQ